MENTLSQSKIWQGWHIADDLMNVFNKCKNVIVPESRNELMEMSVGGKNNVVFEVYYETGTKGRILEATVTKCKNGIAVNYPDPYMRRRDPNCMVVNNIAMTDKILFEDRFNKKFASIRTETLDWLAENELILVPFMAGGPKYGYPALMVAPKKRRIFCCEHL